MKLYVCGLAFDFQRQLVLLVEKNRPSWQAGRYNGLGGHVEAGETPGEAMAREFREETKGRLVASPLYRPDGWRQFAALAGEDWQCSFFAGDVNRDDLTRHLPPSNDVGERLVLMDVDILSSAPLIPNLQWLIPFALCINEYSNMPMTLFESSPGAIRAASKMRSGGKVAARV